MKIKQENAIEKKSSKLKRHIQTESIRIRFFKIGFADPDLVKMGPDPQQLLRYYYELKYKNVRSVLFLETVGKGTYSYIFACLDLPPFDSDASTRIHVNS